MKNWHWMILIGAVLLMAIVSIAHRMKNNTAEPKIEVGPIQITEEPMDSAITDDILNSIEPYVDSDTDTVQYQSEIDADISLNDINGNVLLAWDNPLKKLWPKKPFFKKPFNKFKKGVQKAKKPFKKAVS